MAKVIYEVYKQNITESFNVSGDENLSIKDITDLALSVCDASDFEVIWDQTVSNGQFRKDVSNSKMKSILPNLKFLKLEEGIKKVYQSYHDKISK